MLLQGKGKYLQLWVILHDFVLHSLRGRSLIEFNKNRKKIKIRKVHPEVSWVITFGI